MTELEFKKQVLIMEAMRWIGVKEIGNNAGQIVGLFQSWDGSADQLPWCLAFVQYCLKQTQYSCDFLLAKCTPWHCLPPTEHCLTAWNKTPDEFKDDYPTVGSIVFWSHYKNGKPTGSGHCGIVTGQKMDSNRFLSTEGNTGAEAGDINRNGDGVYSRVRSITNTENFVLLGFVRPWG